jgi:predicted ATP-dependent endonuclease of OLD family
MKLQKAHIKNFRRLEDVQIDFDQAETVFVGPNNSGKTSATAAFRLFLEKQEFRIHDFSVARIAELNAIVSEKLPESIPSIDLENYGSQ